MYLAHWGLRESPFRNDLNCRRFFRSATHDEALARLHFLIDQDRRLGLLLGQSGSGKSLALEVFGHEVRQAGGETASVNLLGIGPQEFYWLLAHGLGLQPARGESTCNLWSGIVDRLRENRALELSTLLLFDDADEASTEVLEQVTRLTQIESRGDARLTVVLSAASHRLHRLGRRLLSLAELRVDLQPWDEEDVAAYLVEALARAGRDQPLFDVAAVQRLNELSQGSPRRVNQLADLSLLAAAGQGLDCVDEATVAAVCDELGVKEAYAPQF